MNKAYVLSSWGGHDGGAFILSISQSPPVHHHHLTPSMLLYPTLVFLHFFLQRLTPPRLNLLCGFDPGGGCERAREREMGNGSRNRNRKGVLNGEGGGIKGKNARPQTRQWCGVLAIRDTGAPRSLAAAPSCGPHSFPFNRRAFMAATAAYPSFRAAHPDLPPPPMQAVGFSLVTMRTLPQALSLGKVALGLRRSGEKEYPTFVRNYPYR